MKLLKELTQLWGVAGREDRVRNFIQKRITPHVDRCYADPLGNLIAVKKGNGKGKRIMLSAHMDEIGLQVIKIEGDGRLRVRAVGWVWTSSLYNSKVRFENGVYGVVGCDGKIEEAKNDESKLFIDIGCDSREEALAHVQIGDYCGFVGDYYELCNDRAAAKSMDDRVGCYMLIKAIESLKAPTDHELHFVFSVQEELGCRGAKVAADRIKPEIGIAIDITPDHYYPSDLIGENAVGKGVGIKLGDPSAVVDQALTQQLIRCCEKNRIPYQRDIMTRGGTDISSINRSSGGVRVVGISVVTRNAHSQSAVVSHRDVDDAVALLCAFAAEPIEFTDPVYK
jgi:endoglucanase